MVRSPIARLVAPVNGLRSALEEIEKRSRALLEKGKAARFIDKGRDSGEVVKLVERLRAAIVRYQVSGDRLVVSNTAYTAGQVSQQQAIHDQITKLTVGVSGLSLSLTLIPFVPPSSLLSTPS
jgi:hypothetical protein